MNAQRDLRRAFRGQVHLPGSETYDDERVTWSKRIDPRPAMVAEALTPADVRAAVLTAQLHDLPFAVQSTGHGTLVPADGGLLLKTSQMAEVLVNPQRQTARVGPGACWGDVIAAAAPLGLAPISGSSMSVGVTGYTLGGGFGWLSRAHGLAADSLLRADIVTADGRLVTATADRNPDLFWAVRGGGANFGVVTALEFRLYPVARVFAGTAWFPRERAAATLARYRDWAASQPDELNASVVVSHDALAIRGLYAGSEEGARRALRPLFEAAGAPVADDWRVMGFADTGSIGGTAPRHFDLFEQLPDAVIAEVVHAVARRGANAVEVRHWGGAIARPGPGAGPAGHHDLPFSITVDGPPEAADGLAPYATGDSFLNFLADPARTHTAYTAANWERLRELKRAYDPDNVFGLSHNIAPARAARPRMYCRAAA
jgi:FAD/FMN-containing dehydrogenase